MHLTTHVQRKLQQLANTCSSIMHRAAYVLLLIIGITSSLIDCTSQIQHSRGGSCIPDERAALLSFRKGIISDSANLLASWIGRDCCRWSGIECSNKTGHVVKLHLHNPNPEFYHSCHDANGLFGEISPSLLSLKHLEHLDLSMSCLLGPNSQIPNFLGSMGKLRYLKLSGIPFTGRVPPQLGNLSNLQYFDIGQNGFDMHSTDIMWLTNLPKLKYLDMSAIDLSGIVDWPHILNMLPSLRVVRLAECSLRTANQSLLYLNLTKLEELDLSINLLDHTIGSSWFWKATSIKYLSLYYNRLFGQIPHALGNMTSLHFLDLSNNLIKELAITVNLANLCNLEVLHFSGNDMNGDITVLMEALSQCAWKQLQEISFRVNCFNGTLPSSIEKFTNLNTLDIYGNNLNGSIPSGIGALTNLVHLDLGFNYFSGRVPSEVGDLTNLTSLELGNNKFTDIVPSEIGTLINLASLGLSNNNFNGTVPYEIGALSNLKYLVLSYNKFSGMITKKHLGTLHNLKFIDLSSNNLKVVVDPDWNHSFRLEFAGFAYCQMGQVFPAWLEWQPEIIQLDISRTGLKGKIPDWFWSVFSHATVLDISHNQISGSLPPHLSDMSFEVLNLGSNEFSGSLPRLPRNIIVLDISNNIFSGTLPYFEAPKLEQLIMNSNEIGGRIPESLCKLVNLEYLDISDNSLKGKIPECFRVELIRHLLLSNNSLSGTFPAFLKNYTQLKFLDLAWNKFHGRLPTWIGELRSLHILRLGHNAFWGTIPTAIAYLSNLQYLDLSSNNISGIIPRNLSSLTCMTLKGFMPINLHTTTWTPVPGTGILYLSYAGEFGDILSISTKGQRLRYGDTVAYLVGIDLSGNSLTGGIPADITLLDAATNLNLSSNLLSGSIPNKIGDMHSLESLDLSNNRLCNEIPSSLSKLSSLSYLNLSYNNLSGRIPSGRQLDTLNADNPELIYVGNSGLCGPPLQRKCSGNGTVVQGHLRSSSSHEFDPLTFYFGLVIGLVAGLWVVFCTFLFKSTWRAAYFQLVDEVYDRIYVYVVVKWASFTRTRGEEE